jgi:macrolide transport system ATP-binding/permease protein
MNWWRRWRQRYQLERQADAELRDHLERSAADHLAAGVPEPEAHRMARIELGGLTQTREACRDARGSRLLDDAAKDARYALRAFARNPGFAAIVVLTLGLGIGANTAIFSLIDAVMWRMLPVKGPRSLLAVTARDGTVRRGSTYELWQALHARSRLADIAMYSPVRLSVSVDGTAEPAVDGQVVSGNYLGLLGINPFIGRGISPEDDRAPNGYPVAMISYGYWSRRFGRTPSTIGSNISIAGKPFTIIGVTPPGFFGVEIGTAPDIFVPLIMQPAVAPAMGGFTARNRPWCLLLARPKIGALPAQTSAELETILRRQSPPPPKRDVSALGGEARRWVAADSREWHIAMAPAGAGLSDLRSQFSQALQILMVAVGVVLLIACANSANLLLARAVARRPEFTMRIALGASRGRLVRQLLVESLGLATLAGALGVLLAYWGTKLLVVYLSAGRAPIHLNLKPDLHVLSFAVAVSVLTSLLFGLMPAVRGTSIDLASSLRGAGTLLNTRGRSGPGTLLAVVQVALSLVLLIGAGLFARSLQNLNGREQFSKRECVLTIRVEPHGSESGGNRKMLDAIYRDLIHRVEGIPGVRLASMAEVTPTNPGPGNSGAVRLASGKYSEPIGVLEIYPNYFAAAGIPMAAGRDLAPRDVAEESPAVCIVNEALVHRFFPNEKPIGKACEGGRIVGVVKDSRVMNPTGALEPMIYVPYLHSHTGRGGMALYVLTSQYPGSIVRRIKEEVSRVDESVPQFEVHTLGQEMNAALIRERLIAMLSALFALLAALLACIGLYGLLAFAVLQRTGEIGIRLALGAARGAVLWMVLRKAMLIASAGVAIGLPSALAVGSLASSRFPGLLFELRTTDAATLATASAWLLGVAVLAAYIPARRASRVDPIAALRSE